MHTYTNIHPLTSTFKLTKQTTKQLAKRRNKHTKLRKKKNKTRATIFKGKPNLIIIQTYNKPPTHKTPSLFLILIHVSVCVCVCWFL